MGQLSFLCGILLVLVLLCVASSARSSLSESMTIREGTAVKCWYINLDRSVDRRDAMEAAWEASTCSRVLTLHRFPAIDANQVDVTALLSPSARVEFDTVKSTGYRTHHHQLTLGAVGCYLSHYELALKLLDEPDGSIYFIMEDDIVGLPCSDFWMSLYQLPDDWDVACMHTLRQKGEQANDFFVDLTGFWGTAAYFVNQRGARVLVKETTEKGIDAQIDAVFSRLAQEQKIRIYALTSNKQTIAMDNSNQSTVQMALRPEEGSDPYEYRGFVL